MQDTRDKISGQSRIVPRLDASGIPNRRNMLVAAFAVLTLQACAGGPPQQAAEFQMETFDLQATTGQEGAYRIFVARPTEPPPPDGYPVIYLLDGNATFPMMLAAHEMPSMAVVGIGYPIDGLFDVQRRYFDLTPPTPSEFLPVRKSESPPTTGGRDGFLTFIERNLKPAIESRLPIDRSRQALFGHSLGGLFTLHVLFTRPEMFQTYVAADPSIWWNGQSILGEKDAFLSRRPVQSRPIRVLIEMSGQRPPRPDMNAAEAARMAKLRTGPTGREIAADLATEPGLRIAFRWLEKESHGSMLPQSVTDAQIFAAGEMPDGTGKISRP